MIAAERTVLVLLAAGKSQRFGSSKLDEVLWGTPLGLHAAITLAPLPFRDRIAVVGDCRIDYAAHGFHVVQNRDPTRDMASSVRLGAAAAVGLDADALLIALADMPCVTAAHVRRLLEAADGADALVASSDGVAAKPPALFGRAHFAALLNVTGDEGGRKILHKGSHLRADSRILVDVDTVADLATLRSSVESAGT